MHGGFASQRDEKDYQLDSQNPHHQQPGDRATSELPPCRSMSLTDREGAVPRCRTYREYHAERMGQGVPRMSPDPGPNS